MGGEQSTPRVKVINKRKTRIKVKIDVDRMGIQAEHFESNRKLGIPGIQASETSSLNIEYGVFHIVDTSSSFLYMEDDEEKFFDMPFGYTINHAFLTIMQENQDKSWSVLCENHPITKVAKVYVGSNVYVRRAVMEGLEFRLPNQRDEYLNGRVVVYNYSSKKNIYVKIDADRFYPIRVAKATSSSVKFLEARDGKETEVSYEAQNKYEVQYTVYYRVDTHKGYTRITDCGERNDFSIFYFPCKQDYQVLKETMFYFSLDYEKPDGTIGTKCVNFPIHYLRERGISWDPFTPHIYVKDQGEGVDYSVHYKSAQFDSDGY